MILGLEELVLSDFERDILSFLLYVLANYNSITRITHKTFYPKTGVLKNETVDAIEVLLAKQKIQNLPKNKKKNCL